MIKEINEVMNTWKIIWHWIDEDGYIREKTVFSTDNKEIAIQEYKQRIKLNSYGWYDIVECLWLT